MDAANDWSYRYKHLSGYALLFCLIMSGAAQAEPLPWLAGILADPFASEEKAAGLVSPELKPDSCQLPDVTHKLHFNDVVIAALCNNPDTKAAYLNLLGQAASMVSNYSGYLPNAAASYDHGRTTSFGENSKSTSINSSYGVSLGMTLYDFGQREFKLETAELALMAAGQSYNSTLQGAIASALQGYYGLLTAQNALGVANESEGFAKASYDAAALRHQIGQVPLADELQAKGSYSQAQLATQSAQNALSLQQAALAILMGLPADAGVQVAEVDDNTLAQDPFGGQVQALMEKAKEKRNDLQASRTSLKASEVSLQALKRGDLATVSATANLNASNDRVNVLSRDASRSQGIGLSVSIPIFTGFSQTYSERAAEKSLEAQRETLIKTELGVEQDVWNAWHNYETAKQSWKTSQDQIASATQLKDVALGRYKEGLGSILDVLNAQVQYSSALQSQLQTRYSLLTSRVDLVRSAGVLDLNTMRPDVVSQDAPLSPPEAKE